MNPILGIAIKDIKTFFREKGAIFWTIAFPLVMMLLFSAIFGREVPFTANVGIVDFDQTEITGSLIQVFNETEIFDVKIFENQQEALDKLKAGDAKAVLIFPKGFQLNITTGKKTYVDLYVDETRPDTAQTVRSGIQAIFAEFNKQIRLKWFEYAKQYIEQFLNITPPEGQAEVTESMEALVEPVSLNEKESLRRDAKGYKEAILPGILTYPFLFSSMAGATSAIVEEKLRGTLKRIRASPAHPLSILWGKTLASLAQTIISVLLLASLAYILLNPKVNWNIPLLAPVIFLGAINGIAIGLLISSIARSPTEAGNAATTIGIILQFFIGMYFPVEVLPSYLQLVSKVVPMTYAADVMRSIMLKNVGFGEILPTITLLLISAAVLYSLGIFLYKRWVEKE
jgi:ABC-2 type transport system permease protein